VPIGAARGATGQDARSDDHPIPIARDDQFLLAQFIPHVKPEDQRHDEKGMGQPESPHAAADPERGFANEARHVAGLHRLENIPHSVRLNSVRVKKAPVPERTQDGFLPAHGRLDGRVIEDIAFGDAQIGMLDFQPGRVADERRDLMALGERLLDQLPARPAGRADDQQPHRLA
jgi:hypothetical protein